MVVIGGYCVGDASLRLAAHTVLLFDLAVVAIYLRRSLVAVEKE